MFPTFGKLKSTRSWEAQIHKKDPYARRKAPGIAQYHVLDEIDLARAGFQIPRKPLSCRVLRTGLLGNASLAFLFSVDAQQVPTFWVAVKEFDLSYHIVDIKQIIWFLDYGNLI